MHYSRMSGAGNTFIMVDSQALPDGANLEELSRWICAPEREDGPTDGFIAIYPWAEGDFEMRYFNRDGSSGMMCGNGGRCAVAFAAMQGYVDDHHSVLFRNAGVVYRAGIRGGNVRIAFPDPHGFKLRFAIKFGDRLHTCHYADVGTPHAVMFIDEMDVAEGMSLAELDIDAWGPPIRNHEAFQPRGANANFVEVGSGGGIHLRTFERGVESETGACGTGAISAAIVASLLRDIAPPIAVTVTSGAALVIDFRRDGDRISGVTMEGPAEVIGEGTVEL